MEWYWHLLWSVTDERDRLSFEFHSNWLFRNGSNDCSYVHQEYLCNYYQSEYPAAVTMSTRAPFARPSTRYFCIMKFVYLITCLTIRRIFKLFAIFNPKWAVSYPVGKKLRPIINNYHYGARTLILPNKITQIVLIILAMPGTLFLSILLCTRIACLNYVCVCIM